MRSFLTNDVPNENEESESEFSPAWEKRRQNWRKCSFILFYSLEFSPGNTCSKSPVSKSSAGNPDEDSVQ